MKKIAKSLRAATVIAIVLIVASFVLGGNFYKKVLADDLVSPSFPTCESKIFSSNGDYTHYDSGTHGIVGVGNREGRDDVYTLTSNDFLQCFCPVEGSNGIQSNWWNVQRDNLTADQISSFKSQGWMEENGSGWNLLNETYLVKNRDFSCAQPTPTLTPVPTVTPMPTLTPTPGPQGPISKCYDLEAQPTEGTAPLTVKFKAHADDPSQNGKIKEYRFDFADASGGQQQVVFQSTDTAYHRYELSGNYEANLRIQDFAGNWRESDDCKVTIKVNAQPQVLGASSPSELPSTGLPALVLASILPLGVAGYKLYRRFRLV